MRLQDYSKNVDDLSTTLTEMCEIAKKYGTDKHVHKYTKIYHELLKDKRNDSVNLFEIGIYMGNSIKMWYDYFNEGKIYGIDNGRLLPNSGIQYGPSNEMPSTHDDQLLQGQILQNYPFYWLENDRIKCAIADQRSVDQLNSAFDHFGCNEFDVILDDGHHYQEHQQKSLGILFKNLKPGGYYIIEDVANINDLLSGQFWGQKNKDCLDSTFSFFKNYEKNKFFQSDYLTKDEIDYLNENVEDAFMFDGGGTGENVPPTCSINFNSRVIVFKKK
jgi:hypothetical protein